MKALDGVGREHEEFRLRLAKERDVELEAIRVRKDMAESQAKVLAEAFSHAKFQIVGGDGAFFERFVKAVSMGTSVDGALEHGEALRTVACRLPVRREGSAGGPEGDPLQAGARPMTRRTWRSRRCCTAW